MNSTENIIFELADSTTTDRLSIYVRNRSIAGIRDHTKGPLALSFSLKRKIGSEREREKERKGSKGGKGGRPHRKAHIRTSLLSTSLLSTTTQQIYALWNEYCIVS